MKILSDVSVVDDGHGNESYLPLIQGERGDSTHDLRDKKRSGFAKVWMDGVPLDWATRDQALDIASLPFIYRNIALMPDAHLGKGSTVGSVIPTQGAVIPSAVGVDIGCGMIARQFDVDVSRLDKCDLANLRQRIEKAVPHGRTDNGGDNDRGAWGTKPGSSLHLERWLMLEDDRYKELVRKYPRLKRARTWKHMGTLGTGNHFIELEKDQNGKLWIMIHSGSRGIGAAIGNHFMMLARDTVKKYYAERWLPNLDLAFFPQGSPEYKDYIMGMHWAQEYAWANRLTMMDLTVEALAGPLGRKRDEPLREVHCHHNYAGWENHFGQNVLVTRKGAISAKKGEEGLIPGAMGKCSYVVEGLGNRDSFHSASHGAGRIMSRTEAKRRFDVEHHAAATAGVECDKSAGTIDETPDSYKDLDAVIQAEKDLVKVTDTLYPLIVVKGLGDKTKRRGKRDPLEAGMDS